MISFVLTLNKVSNKCLLIYSYFYHKSVFYETWTWKQTKRIDAILGLHRLWPIGRAFDIVDLICAVAGANLNAPPRRMLRWYSRRSQIGFKGEPGKRMWKTRERDKGESYLNATQSTVCRVRRNGHAGGQVRVGKRAASAGRHMETETHSLTRMLPRLDH